MGWQAARLLASTLGDTTGEPARSPKWRVLRPCWRSGLTHAVLAGTNIEWPNGSCLLDRLNIVAFTTIALSHLLVAGKKHVAASANPRPN